MPDGETIESPNELETAFGTPVDAFHDYPESLVEVLEPGDTPIKDCCLCHVQLGDYLTAVGATWHYDEYVGGDISVLMLPPTLPVA